MASLQALRCCVNINFSTTFFRETNSGLQLMTLLLYHSDCIMTPSLPPSLLPSLPLSHFLSLFLSLPPSLTLPPSLPFSPFLSLSLPLSHSLPFSISLTLSLSLSHTLQESTLRWEKNLKLKTFDWKLRMDWEKKSGRQRLVWKKRFCSNESLQNNGIKFNRNYFFSEGPDIEPVSLLVPLLVPWGLGEWTVLLSFRSTITWWLSAKVTWLTKCFLEKLRNLYYCPLVRYYFT